MSGIAGVLNLDGRPADLLTLRAMAAAAPYRGPHGARYRTDGPAGLVYQRLTLSADDVIDAQPVTFEGPGLTIVFDGRLDNRCELIDMLGLAAGAVRSDAALVATAYGRWGDACAARLLGDFSFALWDSVRRALFCARDAIGVKPFFYAVHGRCFVFGSDIRHVLAALPGVPPPNEGFLAEVLSRAIRSHTDTFYQGVQRLPAAHTLTACAGALRQQRYWSLDTARELRYGSDGEYAEHFRSLFSDAVRCRLRGDAPVAAYLSGGLDSSAVVGMACSLGRKVETYSLVCPENNYADESDYIAAVVRHWELANRTVPLVDWDLPRFRERLTRRGDMLDLPADAAGEVLYPGMRRNGVRVVLTGSGGDFGFGGSLYHYADLLRDWDLGGFAKQVWADAQISDVGWSASQVFWSGVRPLLPSGVRRAARPLARRLGWTPELPGWVDARLASRVELRERLGSAETPQTGPFSRRHVCGMYASGWTPWLLETGERTAAGHGIEERHPFFDRRVVEFSVAIPERQRWHGRHTKYVVRRALGDLLPPRVAERTDKGDYGICLARGVEALEREGVFDSLTIAALGWVNEASIAALRRQGAMLWTRGDEAFAAPMFTLWTVAGVELWYRDTYGGPRDVDAEKHRAGAASGRAAVSQTVQEAGTR